MDNFTHSITGLAAAELIHRALPAEPQTSQNTCRHRLLLVTGALASNFPDLDLVLTPMLPDPLGYLLHHRGHTHTLLYMIPQAMLLAALIWLLWPAARRLLAGSKAARAGFVLALATGFLLHIGMDYLNSYGVHPFHPFDSRWLYGDMVFIIEPLFWVAFGVPMIMAVPQRQLKAVLAAALCSVLLYFTIRDFLPWVAFGVLLGSGVVLGRLQRRDGAVGKRGLMAGAMIAIVFCGLQHVASEQARAAVTRYVLWTDPASRVRDVSLAGFPANPGCWSFASVQSNERTGLYALQRGIVSIMPAWLPAADCPSGLFRGGKPGATSGGEIAMLSVEHGDLHALRNLSRDNCHFNAWLRFARIPLVYGTSATDARFSEGLSGNFTTIHLDDFKNRDCPGYIPQWDFPRQDLLKPESAQQDSGK